MSISIWKNTKRRWYYIFLTVGFSSMPYNFKDKIQILTLLCSYYLRRWTWFASLAKPVSSALLLVWSHPKIQMCLFLHLVKQFNFTSPNFCQKNLFYCNSQYSKSNRYEIWIQQQKCTLCCLVNFPWESWIVKSLEPELKISFIHKINYTVIIFFCHMEILVFFFFRQNVLALFWLATKVRLICRIINK